jgi:hypothetical protein
VWCGVVVHTYERTFSPKSYFGMCWHIGGGRINRIRRILQYCTGQYHTIQSLLCLCATLSPPQEFPTTCIGYSLQSKPRPRLRPLPLPTHTIERHSHSITEPSSGVRPSRLYPNPVTSGAALQDDALSCMSLRCHKAETDRQTDRQTDTWGVPFQNQIYRCGTMVVLEEVR